MTGSASSLGPGTGETLVMTATFRADDTPILVVRDERERTFQYLCALAAWAGTPSVRRIVFAENSGTAFDFGPIVRHLEQAGKAVEVLRFEGNADAVRFGKGRGEGKILEHVFAHSRLLREAPVFYKITGRLFVQNFEAFRAAAAALPVVFRLRPAKDGHAPKAVTNFFKCSVEVFESRLLHAYHDVTDEEGHRIEQAYYHRLADAEVSDYPIKPVLVGQMGSTGKLLQPYEDQVITLARSFLPAGAGKAT